MAHFRLSVFIILVFLCGCSQQTPPAQAQSTVPGVSKEKMAKFIKICEAQGIFVPEGQVLSGITAKGVDYVINEYEELQKAGNQTVKCELCGKDTRPFLMTINICQECLRKENEARKAEAAQSKLKDAQFKLKKDAELKLKVKNQSLKSLSEKKKWDEREDNHKMWLEAVQRDHDEAAKDLADFPDEPQSPKSPSWK